MQPSRVLDLPTGMTIIFRIGRPVSRALAEATVSEVWTEAPEPPAAPGDTKEDS